MPYFPSPTTAARPPGGVPPVSRGRNRPPVERCILPVPPTGPRCRVPGLPPNALHRPAGELPGGLVLAERESFHAACESVMALARSAEASGSEVALHDLARAVAATAQAANKTTPVDRDTMNRMQLAQDQSVTQLYRATLCSVLTRVTLNYALLETPELMRLAMALSALGIPLACGLKAALDARVQGACSSAFERVVSATLAGDAAASRRAFGTLWERSSDLIALQRLYGDPTAGDHAAGAPTALSTDATFQARRESLLSEALHAMTPDQLALLDEALKVSHVGAQARAENASVADVISRAQDELRSPDVLQRRMMSRAATAIRQVTEASQAVRMMSDITIAQLDTLDQSIAPLRDKLNGYADLLGLLAKTVRELWLELPAAKDHPDVLREMKRAQQRGLEGSRRLVAMKRTEAVAGQRLHGGRGARRLALAA
ncbi:hypothetical protein BH11PSE7_BH11PSE7_31800 [soil metagenome]